MVVHLRVNAEAQHIGLQVDVALVAPQHVQAKQKIRALLHDGDVHGQVLGANLCIHLHRTLSRLSAAVCLKHEHL